MSYVRISEYTGRPATAAGGWYSVKNRDGSDRDGSVRLAYRAEWPAPAATGESSADPSAGRLATTWSGVLTYQFGAPQKSTHVYVLKYPVPAEHVYEFDAWFQHEHMPMLLEEPTWYSCDLYRALGASSYEFAAIHHLERQALTSPARDRSVDTPWWHRLKQHDWFDKGFVRLLLTPL